MRLMHGKKYFNCDSVFDNEKGLKCHKRKNYKLAFLPIPQVDGQLVYISDEMNSK